MWTLLRLRTIGCVSHSGVEDVQSYSTEISHALRAATHFSCG
jgi:hypothetical protein